MEKLLMRMMLNPKEKVVAAYVAYMQKINENNEKGRLYLKTKGYEEVSVHSKMTEDGRMVFESYGKKWAQQKEKHDAEIEESIDSAIVAKVLSSGGKQVETKSVTNTEGLSSFVCPKCSENLQCFAVCPACAAGKIGYTHRYTCINGCVDFVSKEKV